MNKAVQWQQRT